MHFDTFWKVIGKRNDKITVLDCNMWKGRLYGPFLILCSCKQYFDLQTTNRFCKGTTFWNCIEFWGWVFYMQHCDSILTRCQGPRGKMGIITDLVIYTQPLYKLIRIVNSLHQVFTYVNKYLSTIIWNGTSVSICGFIIITHELFINRSINGCMLVK